MKTTLLLLMLMVGPGLALAEVHEKTILVTVLSLIDYEQSVKMFYKSPDRVFIELNPILPGKPSREGMLAMGVAGVFTIYAVEEYIEDGFWKDLFLDSVIATERLNIEKNRKMMSSPNKHNEEFMIVVSINGEF